MKYKIQVPSANGWADLKVTEDDGKTYVDEHFDDKMAADAEAKSFMGRAKNRWRSVTIDTRSDDDLYPNSAQPITAPTEVEPHSGKPAGAGEPAPASAPMKWLSDRDENESIMLTDLPLREAVKKYLEDNGWMDVQYFGDGKVSFTGREYLEKGNIEADFQLTTEKPEDIFR